MEVQAATEGGIVMTLRGPHRLSAPKSTLGFMIVITFPFPAADRGRIAHPVLVACREEVRLTMHQLTTATCMSGRRLSISSPAVKAASSPITTCTILVTSKPTIPTGSASGTRSITPPSSTTPSSTISRRPTASTGAHRRCDGAYWRNNLFAADGDTLYSAGQSGPAVYMLEWGTDGNAWSNNRWYDGPNNGQLVLDTQRGTSRRYEVGES